MKRGIIIFTALLCLFTFTACNKGDNKQTEQKGSTTSQTSASNTDSQSQAADETAEASTEVEEVSRPGMFEREEKSLSPVSQDNVIDLGNGATEEQVSNIEKSGVDETPFYLENSTRAENFLTEMKNSKNYVFTCGDVYIVHSGNDYYLQKEGYLRLNDKSYINGAETKDNYDDRLADSYANLYNFTKGNLKKSVVDYELYTVDGKEYRVTFHKDGISIINGNKQVDYDFREPTEDDLKLLKLGE